MTKEQVLKKIDEIYCDADGGIIQIGAEGENQIKELIQQAINYTRCCTELRDKEVISFRDWVNQNKYTRFGIGYQRNEIIFTREEMWQRFENRN
jgi:hypothetical protein